MTFKCVVEYFYIVVTRWSRYTREQVGVVYIHKFILQFSSRSVSFFLKLWFDSVAELNFEKELQVHKEYLRWADEMKAVCHYGGTTGEHTLQSQPHTLCSLTGCFTPEPTLSSSVVWWWLHTCTLVITWVRLCDTCTNTHTHTGYWMFRSCWQYR